MSCYDICFYGGRIYDGAWRNETLAASCIYGLKIHRTHIKTYPRNSSYDEDMAVASPPIFNTTSDSVKRLMRDVCSVMKHPLHDNGIYYEHNMDDFQHGHALIKGPQGTPYYGGIYLFRFQFLNTYPYAPPVVTFCTGDGVTRFHPNLYECGKVCLSVLNTWPGEPWSSCQTIRSVLLALCTLFTDRPLLEEPQIAFTEDVIQTYSRCVAYKSMEIAMCRQVMTLPLEFHMFHTTMCDHFLRMHDEMLRAIKALQTRFHKQTLHVSVYHMAVTTDYEHLHALCLEAGSVARYVLDAN